MKRIIFWTLVLCTASLFVAIGARRSQYSHQATLVCGCLYVMLIVLRLGDAAFVAIRRKLSTMPRCNICGGRMYPWQFLRFDRTAHLSKCWYPAHLKKEEEKRVEQVKRDQIDLMKQAIREVDQEKKPL